MTKEKGETQTSVDPQTSFSSTESSIVPKFKWKRYLAHMKCFHFFPYFANIGFLSYGKGNQKGCAGSFLPPMFESPIKFSIFSLTQPH